MNFGGRHVLKDLCFLKEYIFLVSKIMWYFKPPGPEVNEKLSLCFHVRSSFPSSRLECSEGRECVMGLPSRSPVHSIISTDYNHSYFSV